MLSIEGTVSTRNMHVHVENGEQRVVAVTYRKEIQSAVATIQGPGTFCDD
jgi:hypothetical protein